ncbi:hypothetical protein BBOV_I004790 [Babesia bovis T2Bo]|uniref:Uncharacterized protein n=1 Tax=Babesia bovis TaxID=5865 RepID=A7AWY2_BABBO|nr:hypothetical protein BBOV_I004790 [Babesia bovis T2Bo]EDO05560.1 hypothetical protein BBOV_I004790 [Babesia bovis T2Bo]|eukprot:XP_001609128.1 hypothetical protein [Babesia bovis T2Bo]
MADDCLRFVYSNDLDGLVSWLKSGSTERWDLLYKSLRNSIHRHDVAAFVCENYGLVGSGIIRRPRKIFGDESLDTVAAGLGSGSIYTSDSSRADLDMEERISIDGYSPGIYIDLLGDAIPKVEAALAFVAIVESLRNRPCDIDRLLPLLATTVERSDDCAQRITTSMAAILQVYHLVEDVSPILEFSRRMWSMDIQESHNVSKMSLISGLLRIHTGIYQGNTVFTDSNTPISVANMLCCWRSDIYSWSSHMYIYNDSSRSNHLDTTSLDDALCCYRLFTSDHSLVPRVYSIPCIISIYLKVAHVLAASPRNHNVDTHTMAWDLAEMSVSLIQSGVGVQPSIPLSAEFIFALLNCHAALQHERVLYILDMLIATIVDDDALVTFFARITPGCDSDTSLSLCLSIFHSRLMHRSDDVTVGTISVLKRVYERIVNSVHDFGSSKSILTSWLDELRLAVIPGSQCHKLLQDIRHVC